MRLTRNLFTYAYGLALACASLVTALPIQAETVTTTAAFDTAGSQNANGYTTYAESSDNIFTWGASFGTGTPVTGGLQATVGNTRTDRRSTTVRKVVSTASTLVETWETSLDFRLDSGFSLSANRTAELWLGFSENASSPSTSSDQSHRYFSRNNTSDGARSMSIKVTATSTTTSQKNLALALFSGGAQQTDGAYSQNSAAYFDNWLRVTYRLVRKAGSDYEASYRLENLGPDGTAEPVLITQSTAYAYTNTYLSSTATTYGAFSLATTTSASGTLPKSAIYVDNHKVSVTSVTPQPPVALAATGPFRTTRLVANWQAPTTGVALQNYVLEMVAAEDEFEAGKFISAAGATDQASGFTLPASTTSQVFQGLIRNHAYKYRVYATNTAGRSPYSNVIQTITSNVNSLPTLDVIAAPAAFFPGDTASRQVALTGISTGGDDDQTVSVSASSGNPSVVTDTSISISAITDGSATLTFIPTGAEGTATITVTVKDFTGTTEESQFSQTFSVRAQQPPISVGFNTADDFSSQYGQGNSANVTGSWKSDAGAGNPATGGVSIVKTGSSAEYYNAWRPQPISLNGKTLVKTSILINLKDMGTTSSNQSGVYLGFAKHVTDGVPSGNPATFSFLASGSNYRAVSTYLGITSNNNGTLSLQTHNKVATSNSTPTTATTSTAINNNGTKNEWLRLSLELSPSGVVNEYYAIATVDRLGADGTGTPVRVLKQTARLANAEMFGSNATAVYPSYNLLFPASSSATGTIKLDDHIAEAITVPAYAPVAAQPTNITMTNLTASWTIAEFGPYPANGFAITAIKTSDPKGTGNIGTFEEGPYMQANGTSFAAQPFTVSSPTAITQLFTNLERGTEYKYHVRAVGAGGALGTPSNIIETSASAMNMLPTLDPLNTPASIYPGDLNPRVVNLTGISHGGDTDQTITVTVTSSDPSVVAVSAPSYTSPNAIGSFTYTPAGITGSSLITVTVNDGEDSVQRSFTVSVRTPPDSYGFDTAEEAAGEYSYAFSPSGINAAWDSSAGIGTPPSGGIVITKTASSTLNAAGWRQQTFDLTNKTFVGTSILINPKEWNGTSSSNATVRTGFVTGTVPVGTTFFSSGTSYRSFYAQLVHNASANTFSLQLYNKASTTNASALGSALTVPSVAHISSGNWLRLSTDIIPTNIGSADYTATVSLENLGPDGTSPAVTLAEYSIALNNTSLSTATTAYAAYDLAQNAANTGKTYLDNHNAVATASVPAAPEALEQELLVKHAFTARWKRPVESAVGGYSLEISRAEDNFAPNTLIDETGTSGNATGIALSSSVTSLRITGLDPAANYVYRIIAYNSLGNSLVSNVVTVTTPNNNFNLPPTLSAIANYAYPITPNSGVYTVNISGITDGGEGDQTVTLSASSSNEDSIPAPRVVNYDPATGTAQVLIEPDSVEDTVTITVTANDGWPTNNLFSRTFTVVVREPPVLVTFDGSNSDWLNEFMESVHTLGTISWNATGGVNGSGGLQLTYSNNDNPHAMSGWRKQPYNLKGKSYLETSVLIKPSGWNEKNLREKFYLGFSHNNTGVTNGSALLYSGTAAGISATLQSYIEDNDRLHFGLGNKAAGSTVSFTQEQIISNGETYSTHWLRIKLILIPTGPSSYNATATLESLGTSGTSAPSLLATSTSTLTNATIANSTSALAAFTTYKSEKENGSIYLDDHSAIVLGTVPNPTTALPATIALSTVFTAHWTEPEESAVDGYLLEVSTTPDFAANTFVSATGAHNQVTGISLPQTARSLRLTGLTPGTNYWYRVKAFNEYGNSEAANVIAVNTLALGANAAPTLNPIVFNYPGVSPKAGPLTVNFNGITDGGEGGQSLQVTAVSSNTEVASHPVVTYTSPESAGYLTFSAGEVEGTAVITVTINDGANNNNTVSRSFNVNVRQAPVALSFNADSGDLAELGLAAGGQSSTASIVPTATGGAGGQGGVEIRKSASGANTTAGWRKQPYSVNDKTALNTSILIKPSAWSQSNSGQFYLGFASNGGAEPAGSAHFMSTGTAYRAVSALLSYTYTLNSSGKVSSHSLVMSLRNKATSNGAVLTGTQVSIANPAQVMTNWLKLSLNVVRTDNTGGLVGEWILESLGANGSGEPIEVARQSNISFTNGDLVDATSAYAAFTMSSTGGSGSFFFDEHNVTAVTTAPNAPAAQPATAVTNQTFITNWLSPVLSVYDGYLLEISTTPNFDPNTLVSATGTASQATGITLPEETQTLRITGLQPGTNYWYRVKAFNAHGYSEPSITQAVTTLGTGINAAPTLASITFPYTRVSLNSAAIPLPLSGITDGGEGGQPLSISVTSSNPAIASASLTSYTSPETTGQIQVVSGQTYGQATITVTVNDGQPNNATFSRQFTVDVQPVPSMISFDSDKAWTTEYSTNTSSNLRINWGSGYGTGSPAAGGIFISNATTSNNRSTSAWRPESHFMLGAQKIRTSILIKPSGWIEKDDDERFFFGFTHPVNGAAPNAPDVLYNNSAYRAMGVRLASRVEDNQFRFGISNKNSTSETIQYTGTDVTGNVTVTNATNLKNNWLRISIEFIPIGSNQFATTATLENLGADGTSSPELLTTVNATITNEALYNSTNAYAAFTSFIKESGNGTIYIDDHFAEVAHGVPSAPTATAPTQITASSFNANWTLPTAVYASGFIVELSTNESFTPLLNANGQPGGAGYTGIPVTGTSVRSLRLSNLTAGTTYFYRVRSMNRDLVSAASNTSSTILLGAGQNAMPTLNDLEAPATIVNSAGNQQVQLTGLGTGGEDELLTITLISSNPQVVPTPIITTVTPTATSGLGTSVLSFKPAPGDTGIATLQFAPAAGSTGTAQITVRVSDGAQQIEKTFLVTVVSEIQVISAGNSTSGAGTTGTIWKYSDVGDLNVGSTWTERSFNDSAWSSGPSTLGYSANNSNIATVIRYGSNVSDKHTTSYYRHQFFISNPADVRALTMRLRCDDGAVVYVNGTEVARSSNMPTGAITYSTRPTNGDNGNAWVSFNVNPALLVLGNNVIAAEVHQTSASDVDSFFDLDMVARLLPTGGSSLANPVSALAATRVTSFGFTANWGNPEFPAPGYLLEVSTQPDFAESSKVVVTGANTREYQFETLVSSSTTYYYRVHASNDTSTVAPPNVIAVTTLSPTQNALPTLDPIMDVQVAVNAGPSVVNLTGISDGGESNQFINSVTVTNDSLSLFSSFALNPAWDPISFADTATLQFTPATGASGSAKVTVTVTDSGSTPNTFSRTFRITVGDAPVGPRLAVQQMPDSSALTSPAAQNLPSTAVGQTNVRTLRLSNTGSETLTGLSLNITGAGASAFSATGLTGNTLAAGASADITLTFAPQATGYMNAALQITGTNATLDPFVINLSGLALQPPVGPRLAVLEMPGATALTSPAAQSFPSTQVGQSATRTVRLSNTGSDIITGLALSLTGAGSESFSTTSLTNTNLAVGAYTDITLTFAPQAAGSLNASLQITSTNASAFVLNLSGSATPAPVGPRLAVLQMPSSTVLTSPASQGFPTTTIGQTSTRTVRLSNTGSDTITGLALSLTGADADAFSASGLAGTSLAAGATTDITLTFAPETEGSLTATLEITSTNVSAFVLNLSGTATDAPIGPRLAILQMPESAELTSPATQSFTTTSMGSLATRIIRLSNTGSDTVSGLAIQLTEDTTASFSVSSVASASLEAGQHTDVTLSFSPKSEGALTAVLKITSSNGLEEDFVLNLQGTGISGDQRVVRPVATPETEAPVAATEEVGTWREGLIGIYDGVLRAESDATQVVGTISKLTVSKPSGSATAGSVSGTLLLDGRSIGLKGAFNADGTVSLSASGITVELKAEETATANGEVLTGTVTWSGGTAVARLPKSVPVDTQTGLYTMLLPSQTGWGADQPGGDGWATVSIQSSGIVAVSGTLGDGTTFTDTAYLSADGEFSIYAQLYAKSSAKGWIGGSLKLRDVANVSDFDGRLHWKKFDSPKDARYKAGFDLQVWAIGSRYTAPAAGQRSLTSLNDRHYNAIVSMIGLGSSSNVSEKVVSWQSSNKVVYYGPDTLSAAAIAKTGLLSGKYQDKPNKGAAISFKGVVFQKQGRAAGNFLHTQGSGALRIIPGTEYEYPGSEAPSAIPVARAPETPATPGAAEDTAWDVAATGSYTGVLTDSTGQQGALESLVITNKGAFTATLWIQGVRHQLKGTVDTEGNLQVASVQPANENLSLALKLAKTTEGHAKAFQITGQITSGTDTLTLSADRRPDFAGTERSPHEGIYTLAALQGDETEAPFGDGYASLKVSNKGLSTGALVLSDGSKTTFAGHVSVDGVWNFYRSLYKNSGWVGGRVNFRSTSLSDLDGTWTWVKNAGIAKTPAYAEGFTVSRLVTGSKFIKPARGERAFTGLNNVFYNVRLHLTTSTSTSAQVSPLVEPLSPVITWTADNKLLFYGPEAVKLTFNSSTGLVTGSYVDKASGLKLNLGGVLLQKQSLVTGFHTDGKGRFGGLILEPR